MKEDRIITTVGILAAVMAVLMLTTGNFIMGGIVLLLSFGIFWNRGGGKFNDRSLYEKTIKTDVTIEELFEKIKDTDTPLGRAWIAGHKGFEGKSIVFGPDRFKDCIVISHKKDYLDVKHITLLDNIIRDEKDEYRFQGLINAADAEVTPERYSAFAGLKLASVMLVRHLYELIQKFSENRNATAPERLDFFKFYYHNSSEGYFRDTNGSDIIKVVNAYKPFEARIFDMDGSEMASVKPRAFNAKGLVMDQAGFDLFANGEHFGEIRRFKEGKEEGFIAETDAGEFRITIFPSCLRANISCNYTVSSDGALKAVIGGSPKLVFDTCGTCQNDLILSYDDDYLVLYAILEIFIMTLNRGFLK